MPGFNQKGPMGQGSMTGRKMGKCTNFGASLKVHSESNTSETQIPVTANFLAGGFGRGYYQGEGRGRTGRGMGRQNRFRGGE